MTFTLRVKDEISKEELNQLKIDIFCSAIY